MSGETRGNRTYYYTAKRVGDRVVKRYVGSGTVAELATHLEAATRAQTAATACKQQQ